MAAARNGDIVAPLDTRYLQKGIPKKGEKSTDSSRQRIVTFLRGIYESIAETLPDIRDDTWDGVDTSSTNFELPELVDPYSEVLGRKVKKPRKRKFSLQLNQERRDVDIFEERFLPPGSMKEYHEQMRATELLSQDEKPVAFSTFWRVWTEDFPFLRFRPTSSHAACGTCIRHKLLIRSFNGHLKARRLQVECYSAHLKAQYCDRLQYWELRGTSRLRSGFDVLLILDGMDQAKFSYPRSELFKSKDLQGMPRARAHICGVVVHGRFILFTISPSTVAKDANSCIEITAHCLHLLSKEMPLNRLTLHIQSDNTSREVKNNHYLRFLASLVSHRPSENFDM